MNYCPISELEQPFPRNVRIADGFLAIPIFLAVICIITSIFLLGAAASFKWNEQILNSRGVITAGHVTTPLIKSKKHANFLSVSYEFTTHDGRKYTGSDRVGQEYFDSLFVGSTISVIYDPNDPIRSTLRYPGMESVTIPLHSLSWTAALSGGLMFLMALIGLATLRRFLKRKRLLETGTPMEAIVIDAKTSSAKSVFFVTIRFRLCNQDVIHKSEFTVGSRAAAAEAIAAISANPIAIVTPDDTDQCILYLSKFDDVAVIAPRS